VKAINIFEQLPRDLEQEAFEKIIEREHVAIERIVSRGHTSPDAGWYDQARCEWVMLLQGAASLEFEDGAEVTLRAGDYLDIPAHARHRVTWTAHDVETIWLAVHYQ
jgi:cupin 2 domain-containing protein